MPDATDKVTTACPDCGTIYRVRPEGVGRKARCQCGTVFTVLDVPEPGQGYDLARNEPSAGVAEGYHPATPGWSVPPMAGDMAGGMAGVMCMNHPMVPAVRRCGKCGQGVCSTCGFSFPNGVFLCPTCATDTRVTLSRKRQTLMWFSVGLAITASVGFVGIFALVITMGRSKEAEAVAGCGLILLSALPALVGAVLGFSALDRRRGNKPLIWVGAIWNTAIVSLWLLLIIVGMMRG